MVRAVRALETVLGTLPKTLLFDQPDCTALAAHLTERFGAEAMARIADATARAATAPAAPASKAAAAPAASAAPPDPARWSWRARNWPVTQACSTWSGTSRSATAWSPAWPA